MELFSFQKLEALIFKNCAWLSNGAVEIFAFHYPDRIKIADFSGCLVISESSIILFIKRQKKWLHLSAQVNFSLNYYPVFVLGCCHCL